MRIRRDIDSTTDSAEQPASDLIGVPDVPHDVSVVVCVRNSIDLLPRCLDSVRANYPRELVVVDGLSTDGSFEVAQRYADKVISDEGRGLAAARKLGADACCGAYVLNLGPDNVLPEGFLAGLVRSAEQYGYAATGAQTRLLRIETVWDRWLDNWWQYMMPVGPREVVGTPCLFRSDVLNGEPFNAEAGTADDTELCYRLRKKGLQLGVVPVAVFETGGWHWKDIVRRFSLYGKADADFYAFESPRWTLRRKISSWLHPLRHTYKACKWSIANGVIQTIPFFLLIGYVRYAAWIRQTRRSATFKPH